MATHRAYRGEDALEAATADAAKGERFRDAADKWIEDNPEAWAFIVQEARDRTARCKRFGMGELCEQVRWHMRAKGDADFKLNNNHRARFTRRLVEEHPECRPYVRTRDSVVDL